MASRQGTSPAALVTNEPQAAAVVVETVQATVTSSNSTCPTPASADTTTRETSAHDTVDAPTQAASTVVYDTQAAGAPRTETVLLAANTIVIETQAPAESTDDTDAESQPSAVDADHTQRSKVARIVFSKLPFEFITGLHGLLSMVADVKTSLKSPALSGKTYADLSNQKQELKVGYMY